jgi:hypothetical protein
MNEKEILIPASIIKENKDSYTVSIPGIGFNTEKKISKEGVVILEENECEEHHVKKYLCTNATHYNPNHQEETKKDENRLLGTLFGQDVKIDMSNCDPRTFDHAKDFFDNTLQTAEKLKEIIRILDNK